MVLIQNLRLFPRGEQLASTQHVGTCTFPSTSRILFYVFIKSQGGESRGRAERYAERASSVSAAIEMLDAFSSVGANAFDLTITSENGEKVSFRRGVRGQELRRGLPDLLARCGGHRWNLIVRPKSPPVFLQLDDLDGARRDQLESVSFLSLETSPGNYQYWIALPAVSGDDFARRLRGAVGADPTASGATRVAGSYNFKPKYAPEYPVVRVHHTARGLLVTEADLITKGFAPPPHTQRPLRPKLDQDRLKHRQWPSYQRCVAGAPYNHNRTARDISRADFTFALIALDWGWSVDEVADRLMLKSRKARENGLRYAFLTASRAAEAIARRYMP